MFVRCSVPRRRASTRSGMSSRPIVISRLPNEIWTGPYNANALTTLAAYFHAPHLTSSQKLSHFRVFHPFRAGPSGALHCKRCQHIAARLARSAPPPGRESHPRARPAATVPPPAPVEHVRVDHRRPHIAVAEELLYRPDVVAVLEQMRGERVPECMARCGLGEAHLADCPMHRPLDHGLVQMVAAPLAGDRFEVRACRRKDPLPRPLAPRVGVLPPERVRHLHPSGSGS